MVTSIPFKKSISQVDVEIFPPVSSPISNVYVHLIVTIDDF